ncbi:MAG TPA: RDD family protein [Sandaracinaceae bacterium LLY-WYZ-13_1]|nr:RDD family protein [Sandaracinaceae bacterium LLY-WYZ-13_1]
MDVLVAGSPRLRSLFAFVLEVFAFFFGALWWTAHVEATYLPVAPRLQGALVLALAFGLFAAYRIAAPLRFAGTPIQRLFGLRIVRADGEPLTARHTTQRLACQLLEAVGLVVTGPLGMLVLLAYHARKGTWPHDRWAGTRVVLARDAEPPSPPGPPRF